MERIQSINLDRIRWCCQDRGVTLRECAIDVGIAQSTLEKLMKGEDSLTFNQLRNIAAYFNRGVLFFLEPSPVEEAQVRSPAFRTIANDKPDLSPIIKALIERVELHRDIYLSLWEDLDEEEISTFHPPKLAANNPKQAAAIAREWLELDDQGNFNSYRAAVESKGVLVFRSMGYHGAWRIPADSSVVGFSLYHARCPVIVVKKAVTDSPQTFTLMHELGHILLHRSSVIDEEADLFSYQGRERVANSFAGHLLVPDSFLSEISDQPRPTSVEEYPFWLRPYTQRWGISTEVILRRLYDVGRLDQAEYQAYRDWRSRSPLPVQSGGTRQYRSREPLHIFGRRFVRTVLEALHGRHISLNKASAYLDNLKVRDIHALEAHLADF